MRNFMPCYYPGYITYNYTLLSKISRGFFCRFECRGGEATSGSPPMGLAMGLLEAARARLALVDRVEREVALCSAAAAAASSSARLAW